MCVVVEGLVVVAVVAVGRVRRCLGREETSGGSKSNRNSNRGSGSAVLVAVVVVAVAVAGRYSGNVNSGSGGVGVCSWGDRLEFVVAGGEGELGVMVWCERHGGRAEDGRWTGGGRDHGLCGVEDVLFYGIVPYRPLTPPAPYSSPRHWTKPIFSYTNFSPLLQRKTRHNRLYAAISGMGSGSEIFETLGQLSLYSAGAKVTDRSKTDLAIYSTHNTHYAGTYGWKATARNMRDRVKGMTDAKRRLPGLPPRKHEALKPWENTLAHVEAGNYWSHRVPPGRYVT